jgi:hypothetical protein
MTTTPQFISRNGALLTNNSLNITAGNDYRIDDVPVISATALGVTITTSNLKQVGTLNTLAVSGDAVLGEFAFFNTTFNRLGLGTEDPSHSLSIIDNNVEIGLGSPDFNHAEFGTYSNHTLTFVTDGLPRIVVNSNGNVSVSGDLSVQGTLTVNNLVSETRITKTAPVEFLPSTDSGIYGLGLVWSAVDYQRQFIFRSDPDRIWSTNSIDLESNQAYYINGRAVLNETILGASVTQSNLMTLGVLQELTVAGNAVFHGEIIAANTDLSVKSLKVTQSSDGVSTLIDGSTINTTDNLVIQSKTVNVLQSYNDGITIGDFGTAKPVRVAGTLSIGINNPDSNFDLEVAGNVKLNNKKFITGFDAPTQGDFNQGDICWNANPTNNGYVGWICTVAGAPGVWLPFGGIGHR